MKSFINVQDLGPIDKALAEAMEIKNDRYKYQHLGKNKTLMMIFFNNSLRTRLSTQKAAKNPGVTCPEDYGKITCEDRSWTVDTEHMSWTNNGKFMHCLPVRRNLIVTDDVIESENSLVIPEAANREISCSVVLKRMLEALATGASK